MVQGSSDHKSDMSVHELFFQTWRIRWMVFISAVFGTFMFFFLMQLRSQRSLNELVQFQIAAQFAEPLFSKAYLEKIPLSLGNRDYQRSFLEDQAAQEFLSILDRSVVEGIIREIRILNNGSNLYAEVKTTPSMSPEASMNLAIKYINYALTQYNQNMRGVFEFLQQKDYLLHEKATKIWIKVLEFEVLNGTAAAKMADRALGARTSIFSLEDFTVLLSGVRIDQEKRMALISEFRSIQREKLAIEEEVDLLVKRNGSKVFLKYPVFSGYDSRLVSNIDLSSTERFLLACASGLAFGLFLGFSYVWGRSFLTGALPKLRETFR